MKSAIANDNDEIKRAALQPPVTVLVKLGSITIHAEEVLSEKCHPFDVDALKALLNDKDVKEWLANMDRLSLLPKKR